MLSARMPPPQPFIPAQPDFVPPSSPAQEALAIPIEHRFGFQVEGAFIFPIVRQHLHAPVTVDGLYTTTAALPTADMDLGGAVSFNLVYNRFGPGVFSATYRLLASEGRDVLTGFDPAGDAFLRSRLDMNTVDLDYGSRGIPLGPLWLVRWQAGAKLASVFFDSRADGPTLERHISNSFFGAGPHAAFSLTRTLGNSGLALYGRFDGGVVFGEVRQKFSETVWAGDTPIAYGKTSQAINRGIPMLNAQIGLSASPFSGRFGRWQAGYQFEQWWTIGNVGASTGDLILHGIFARWTYIY